MSASVKPARCFANPTFCTTLRLRGRSLGAPLFCFRFVCIPRGSSWWRGIRVSSRLIRMIGRPASRAVSSAKFHNFHAAVAWRKCCDLASHKKGTTLLKTPRKTVPFRGPENDSVFFNQHTRRRHFRGQKTAPKSVPCFVHMSCIFGTHQSMSWPRF